MEYTYSSIFESFVMDMDFTCYDMVAFWNRRRFGRLSILRKGYLDEFSSPLWASEALSIIINWHSIDDIIIGICSLVVEISHSMVFSLFSSPSRLFSPTFPSISNEPFILEVYFVPFKMMM